MTNGEPGIRALVRCASAIAVPPSGQDKRQRYLGWKQRGRGVVRLVCFVLPYVLHVVVDLVCFFNLMAPRLWRLCCETSARSGVMANPGLVISLSRRPLGNLLPAVDMPAAPGLCGSVDGSFDSGSE